MAAGFLKERVTYEGRILKAGEADVPGPEVYWMSEWNRWETLAFSMVRLRGGGHTVLINTGPPPDLTELNAAWTAGYGASAGLCAAGRTSARKRRCAAPAWRRMTWITS